MNDERLADRTVLNVLWSFASFAGSKAINLISLVILARLLGPQTFGLMAICVAVMAYFEIVARFGLGAALISRNDDVEPFADAVFGFALLASGLMAASMWVAAPWLAEFFGEPSAARPMQVIALTMVIEAVGVVPATLMVKHLQFRRKLKPDLIQSLAKSLIAIALAMAGYGVWALVLGFLAGTAVGTVAKFVVYPWRPRAWPRLGLCRDALRFGSHLLLAESLNAMQRNLDALLVGKLLGTTALGIYSLAYRFPEIVIRSFNQVSGIVIHPLMSEMNGEPNDLARYYYSCLRYVSLITLPAGVAISFTAAPLVRVLYGEQWHEMIVPMQYLSLALALLTLDFLPGLIYKAINRPVLMLAVSAVKLPVFVFVLYKAAEHGIDAIAKAQVALSIFYFLPNYIILRVFVPVELGKIVISLWPALVTAGCVAAGGLIANGTEVSGPLPLLLLSVITMGLLYVMAVRLVAPEVMELGRRLAGNMRIARPS